ncbi:MAG TPA: ABC transporter permease [Gemmatimonadaceae bacterium]|nr:ABC transporter permease [Gemmatimonadaceae bacterium]
METWWHDLRHGLRVLASQPAFAAVAVASLALGIGANTAIFSVTNALLLRPLPYEDAERIAILWQRSPGLGVAQDWFSIGQYLDIKTDNQVFTDVAATIGASFNLTGQGLPERVDGARVSSSLFPLFGAKAAAGRVFAPDEDAPGKPPVVILSNGFWKRRFGSDPNVVGRSLTLNGNTFTVVGVMAADFVFNKEIMPAVNGIQNVDLLLPLPLNETARTNRGGEDFNIFARLKPGVTIEKAQAAMNVLAARMKRDYPQSYPPNGGLTVSVVPLINQVVGDVRLALYVLLGAVGLVLLIACGNVANLLLSRAAVRAKEMAIRAAVGASRERIVRQLLTEAVLLATLGGILGLGLAVIAVGVLGRFGPAKIPRIEEIGIDGRVLAFTFAISLITGVVFGLVPALRASRLDLNDVLREGGRSGVGTSAFGMGHQQLRQLLISGEIAMSLVLLIGAGLLIRSYERITNANPGFDSRNVLSLRISLPGSKYKTPELAAAFYRDLESRIKALPGVQYVGSNYLLPLSSVALAWEPISIEGYVPKAAGEDLIIASSGYVSSDYFKAMGIPLLKGRYFDERDVRGAPDVTIVDDKLAERFWPGQDPLGKRMRRGDSGPWRTVVGVVADAKEYDVDGEPPITAFYPAEQLGVASRYLVIKTNSDPTTLVNAVTREVRALDADLPLYDVNTMDERLADSFARRRFSMLMLAIFAASAALIAAIGIYGVVSFWVSQRTRELGIRAALGAGQYDIMQLVLRQAVVLVGVGIVVGIAAAFGLTRVMSSLLFGVSATDVTTYAVVAVALGIVALVATYVPARRAAGVPPIVALRHD